MTGQVEVQQSADQRSEQDCGCGCGGSLCESLQPVNRVISREPIPPPDAPQRCECGCTA